jgi:hypothetical protein
MSSQFSCITDIQQNYQLLIQPWKEILMVLRFFWHSANTAKAVFRMKPVPFYERGDSFGVI